MIWNDTRLSLESNKPRGSWYGLTEVDQNEIYFPTLQISGAKTIQRTRKYGPKDSDYFWFKSPHNFEYQQALKATIYCSFDFQTYPFDAHYCDFNFVPTDNTIFALSLDPPELRFNKLESKSYKKYFLTFHVGLMYVLDLRNLQEQVKKAFGFKIVLTYLSLFE